MSINIEAIESALLKGMNIVPDVHVSDYHTVDRSWKERLFTFPWKPLQKTTTIHGPKCYVLENTIIVSYETYYTLLNMGVVNDHTKE